MIELYSSPTPNGRKIPITLEEMGLAYNLHEIDLSKQEQKLPEFLKINPNGRIPAIVDTDENDFAVFESGAILIYLSEKTGKLMPKDKLKRSQVLQWLMFQMGGIGPMQGQANVFYRYAPEHIPFAIKRYQNETRRLYEVLNAQLQDREYIADEYSIVDIATYPWIEMHEWSGIETKGLTHLESWIKRMATRPAVIKGMQIPADPAPISDQEEFSKLGKSIVTE